MLKCYKCSHTNKKPRKGLFVVTMLDFEYMKKQYVLLIILILLLIGSVGYNLAKKKPTVSNNDSNSAPSNEETILQKDRIPTKYVCVGEFCDGSGDSNSAANRTVVQIPLIKDGGKIGCGVGIFFAPHTVPKTTAVLDATYKLLFDLKPNPEISSDGFRNTVGEYNALQYESVSITNGTAKLLLSGDMTGPGHCAEPELREQINQAAFHFDSLKKIEVYLNGKLFNWCWMSDADPSEDHCDTNPRYWIDTK